MKVYVTSRFLDEKVEGLISGITPYSSQEPKVDQISHYRFTVEFKEELEEDILTGSHVELKIITKEVENALTLPVTTMKDESIYVLATNGTVQKREVQTGLQVNEVYEIISGAEAEELFINNPSKIKNNTTFFTPINIKQINKKHIKTLTNKEKLRYLTKGLLTS